MNFKKAFTCKKCPQSNGENGCPMWWEFSATNVETGQSALKKMCGYQALPTFLTEVIIASNRPAAEIGAMRCEAENQKDALVSALARVTQTIQPAHIENRNLPYLTNGAISDGSLSG